MDDVSGWWIVGGLFTLVIGTIVIVIIADICTRK